MRQEFSTWLGILTVALGAVSVVTTWQSTSDAEGEGLGLIVPIGAPAVVSCWAVLELVWRRTDLHLAPRILLSCLIAPLPSALLGTLVVGVTSALPAASARISAARDANSGFHYWWDDGPGPLIGVWTFLGSWGVGGGIGMILLLIVVMPVLAWTRSGEVLDGTRVEDNPHGRLIITGIYVAIAVVVLALCVARLT